MRRSWAALNRDVIGHADDDRPNAPRLVKPVLLEERAQTLGDAGGGPVDQGDGIGVPANHRLRQQQIQLGELGLETGDSLGDGATPHCRPVGTCECSRTGNDVRQDVATAVFGDQGGDGPPLRLGQANARWVCGQCGAVWPDELQDFRGVRFHDAWTSESPAPPNDRSRPSKAPALPVVLADVDLDSVANRDGASMATAAGGGSDERTRRTFARRNLREGAALDQGNVGGGRTSVGESDVTNCRTSAAVVLMDTSGDFYPMAWRPHPVGCPLACGCGTLGYRRKALPPKELPSRGDPSTEIRVVPVGEDVAAAACSMTGPVGSFGLGSSLFLLI